MVCLQRMCTRKGITLSISQETATVFWVCQLKIFFDQLKKGKIITGACHASLVDCQDTELCKKCSQLTYKKVLFHHDNSPTLLLSMRN